MTCPGHKLRHDRLCVVPGKVHALVVCFYFSCFSAHFDFWAVHSFCDDVSCSKTGIASFALSLARASAASPTMSPDSLFRILSIGSIA